MARRVAVHLQFAGEQGGKQVSFRQTGMLADHGLQQPVCARLLRCLTHQRRGDDLCFRIGRSYLFPTRFDGDFAQPFPRFIPFGGALPGENLQGLDALLKPGLLHVPSQTRVVHLAQRG